MGHVCADEVPCGEGTEERKFPSHNGRSNDTRKRLCVLSWLGGMGTLHTKEVQTALLWSEDGTASNSPNFYAGHGNGHKKIFATVGAVQHISEKLSVNEI